MGQRALPRAPGVLSAGYGTLGLLRCGRPPPHKPAVPLACCAGSFEANARRLTTVSLPGCSVHLLALPCPGSRGYECKEPEPGKMTLAFRWAGGWAKQAFRKGSRSLRCWADCQPLLALHDSSMSLLAPALVPVHGDCLQAHHSQHLQSFDAHQQPLSLSPERTSFLIPTGRHLEDAIEWGCALQQELLGFAWPETGAAPAPPRR